jgi:hypothetical protein
MQVASPANLAAQAQAELITQPLYSTITVADAATSTVFFNGTGAGNRFLTNVDQNGVLPHPKFFRIGGFRLVPDHIVSSKAQATQAEQVSDMISLLTDGWYEFKIGDLKPYLQVPNYFIPSGVGPVYRGMSNITAAATDFAYSVGNGQELFSNFLRIKHWISLPPLQSFQATITWSSLGLNASQKITNFLDGEYGREVL